MNKFLMVFGIVGAIAFLTGCTDAEEAERALDNLGMTDIEITGWRFFGCDDRDGWRTGFRATNSNGRAVEGAVCSGIFKGATVRFD